MDENLRIGIMEMLKQASYEPKWRKRDFYGNPVGELEEWKDYATKMKAAMDATIVLLQSLKQPEK